MLNKFILYCLENTIIPILLLLLCLLWGVASSPFDIAPEWLPTDPVAVDAIPDIGDNQQIVFTEWPGQSPQDIEDQITYPLTSALLGVPGVKSIRSSSIFGMSGIYVIFDDDIEFYWSRSRVLEKINTLPQGMLPKGVLPTLGPDATGLGQIFWYTLEGQDSSGNPTGGWNLQELRTIQDFTVKYALNGVDGVSEVGSIGGYVTSYQVQVDPSAMIAYGVSLPEVVRAVQASNKDVGAKTMEINQVEYLIRGLGRIESLEDLENSIVQVVDDVPIPLSEVANIQLAPMMRRGVLDKDGAEVVGGVVVARYGSNPMEVIHNVKERLEMLSNSLPKKTLSDGTISQLTVVPFYDRSHLIQETLGTLRTALYLEVLITIVVILLMLSNVQASFVVALMLPLSVLFVFSLMKVWGVEANIVALSGIAIAIGTMVDLGIVFVENVLRHFRLRGGSSVQEVVYEAISEVSAPILTTVSTTILGFIPIFLLTSAEGKLFRPLAFTKTSALVASLLVLFVLLPTIMKWVLTISKRFSIPALQKPRIQKGVVVLLVVLMVWWLNVVWMPLPDRTIPSNLILVSLLLSSVLGFFYLLHRNYTPLLRGCLAHKKTFLSIPIMLVTLAICIWFGLTTVLSPVLRGAKQIGISLDRTSTYQMLEQWFPGIGSEFMPALDEGAFLFMPTSMAHSGMEYNTKVLATLDALVSKIPEVESVVGKLGRANTALDLAPISMFENIIQYKPEFRSSTSQPFTMGRFAVTDTGEFRLSTGEVYHHEDILEQNMSEALVEDANGLPFRNWRSHIQSPDDIWQEIVQVTQIPGVTSAPKLQPIETRLVMLRTGMRAPMGLKVFGPNLESIAQFSSDVERLLKQNTLIAPNTVFAERVVGKPYVEVHLHRPSLLRYGLFVEDVQQSLSTAVGGQVVSTVIQGRERIPIEVRYPAELRQDIDALERIVISASNGREILLRDIADIVYERGPQQIKSEDTFLVGYVLFDKIDAYSAGDVVSSVSLQIEQHIDAGTLKLPEGVYYRFAGSYQQQQHAMKRLLVVVPLVLLIIVVVLYLQFESIGTVAMIFGGVLMSFSGAFILLWLYGQADFFDITIASVNIQRLFQIHPIHLSVAVWVGFVALFGIATDDGVLMGTQLDCVFAKKQPQSIVEIQNVVVEAGQVRITPAIMTSATTIIALLPILTSTGRGADIMIPMAIPMVGGMLVASLSYFIVPVLYAWRAERQLLHLKEER